MAQLKDLIVNGASRLIGDVYISGDATAATSASGSNDTKVATTAFVKTAVDNAINNAKQTKTVTPATYAQNVDPDSGKILSRVTVNAIPNQRGESGYYHITATNSMVNYPGNAWYYYDHGAYVEVYTYS